MVHLKVDCIRLKSFQITSFVHIQTIRWYIYHLQLLIIFMLSPMLVDEASSQLTDTDSYSFSAIISL